MRGCVAGLKESQSLGDQIRAQGHDTSRIRYDRSDVNNMVLVSPNESSGKLEHNFSV